MNINLFKLKLSAYKSNFNLGPKGIAYELIKLVSKEIDSKNATYLDLGCRNADLIKAINKKGLFKKIFGLDINKDAIEKAKKTIKDKKIKIETYPKNSPLPLEDNSIDILSMVEVLEHIKDRESICQELYRVLSFKGKLIITVPRKHIFSFTDIGNLKFRFPFLHKIFYTLKFGKEAYNFKYTNNPYGLFGDIEKEAGWHYHFKDNEIISLAESVGFKLIKKGSIALFFFPLCIAGLISHKIFPILPVKKVFEGLMTLDAFLFSHARAFYVLEK